MCACSDALIITGRSPHARALFVVYGRKEGKILLEVRFHSIFLLIIAID